MLRTPKKVMNSACGAQLSEAYKIGSVLLISDEINNVTSGWRQSIGVCSIGVRIPMLIPFDSIRFGSQSLLSNASRK